LSAALVVCGFGAVCNAYLWCVGPDSAHHYLNAATLIGVAILDHGLLLAIVFSLPLLVPRLFHKCALTSVLAYLTLPLFVFNVISVFYFSD